MKRRYIAHSVAAAVVLAGTAATAAVATEDETPPTFSEFKASTVTDGHGQYVVNGDEPVSEKTLRAYYERMLSDDGKKGADGSSSLVVNTVGGQDDMWAAEEVGNLSYCVSDDFGGVKDELIAATEQGANQWEEAAAAINFEYVSSEDGNCNTSNSNVVFSVEPTDSPDFIARAFFPSSGKSERNILVNADALLGSGSWTPANIMAHELGHTLGFRHEHTRPEAGTCFEDNNWRPLTPYDAASIMHYPQCNGSSDDLSMTDSDREGASSLYGG